MVQGSPFTFHISPFTVNLEPFTFHLSHFTTHRSHFTFHHSHFTFHLLPFPFHLPPFTFHISPFAFHLSPFTLRLANPVHLSPGNLSCGALTRAVAPSAPSPFTSLTFRPPSVESPILASLSLGAPTKGSNSLCPFHLSPFTFPLSPLTFHLSPFTLRLANPVHLPPGNLSCGSLTKGSSSLRPFTFYLSQLPRSLRGISHSGQSVFRGTHKGQ
jgi:hypothetical protein